jgi:hypothetical protein
VGSRQAACVTLLLAAACGAEHATGRDIEFPVTLLLNNRLIAPVTVAVDGVPVIGLDGGGSSSITVSSMAQWLTWTSAKPLDAVGRPIPDDIGEVRVSVGGINRVLEIVNVIDDQTYFTAGIYNNTTAAVSIGVDDGTSVACVSALPGKSGLVRGFTQIGYYRLMNTTVLRAFRDPTLCTGPSVTWSTAQLKTFNSKSGLLTLTLDTAP